MGEVMLDSDDHPERRDLGGPRPNACDSSKDNYDVWLDPGMQNVAAVSEMLKPYDAKSMRSYPVSTRINHVANDDEECSRPVDVAQTQDSLFS